MPSEKLEERVHQIMSEDLPDIRVQLTKVAVGQDRILEKIEGVEAAVTKAVDAMTDSNKRINQQEVRLASVEATATATEKKRDRWRAWFMGIGASLTTAVLIYALKFFKFIG